MICQLEFVLRRAARATVAVRRSPTAGFAVAVVMLVCGPAFTARADSLTLTNGDHLTGVIVKSDAVQLVFHTDYAGDLTVKRSSIREMTTDKPLYAVTADGKTLNGIASVQGTDLVLTPAAGESQRAPLANVTALHSEDDYKAYLKSIHPGLLDNWVVNETTGFSATTGNSRTTNLALAFDSARTTLHDKLSLSAAAIYARSETPGSVGVSANDIRGGARYDHGVDGRLFAYGTSDFEFNQPQMLNLRSVVGLGLGFHMIQRKTTTLDALGSFDYTRESYATGLRRNIANASIGEDFSHDFGHRTTLSESFFVFPDFTNTGQYRLSFDTSANTKITQWLGWQTTISNRYLSDPIPGTLSNDFIFTTGVNIQFKH